MVDATAFNFDPPSRALSQTQHNIRVAAHKCIDKLPALKAHRKYSLRQSRLARQTSDDSGRDIIGKSRIRTEAVN
jgi:hypothetical protein